MSIMAIDIIWMYSWLKRKLHKHNWKPVWDGSDHEATRHWVGEQQCYEDISYFMWTCSNCGESQRLKSGVYP